MKILCLNCKPDFTWLTSKGLKLDVIYTTSPKQIYPIKSLYKIVNSLGISMDMNIPDVSFSVANITGYDVIMVGWNPSDYSQSLINIGGYAYPDKQPNGARIISVRVDDIPYNMYPIHEMMHTLCNFINIDFKDYVPKDFMDQTPVNGIWKPYYKNDYNITDSDSNFNQTWRNIIPFLDRLNLIKNLPRYKYFSQKEVDRFKLVPKLWEIMDIVRGLAGIPVIGTSGLRTSKENLQVGGMPNSSHLRALAFDWLCTDNFKRAKFVKAVLNCGTPVFLEVAKGHIHIDIDPSIHEMGQMIILGDE